MQHWNGSIKFSKYAFSETSKWVSFLKKYGVVVLANTPHDSSDENRRFYNKLSKTLNTSISSSMYGEIWDTAGDFGSPTTDTAYTNFYIPPHTDLNYVVNTPSYQIFTSVIEADIGGETVLVDGWSVAEEFKLFHPEAYDRLTMETFLFTCSENRYKCAHKIFDEETDIIHHNDGDMENVDMEEYKLWNDMSLDPYFQTMNNLIPGDTIVINNHRVFHSRNAFVGKRNLKGCYFN